MSTISESVAVTTVDMECPKSDVIAITEEAGFVEEVKNDVSIEEKDKITRKKLESLPNVRITDSDTEKGLDLYCYTKCSPDDDEIVHNSRGIVFHNDEIVMKAFPYTVELNYDEAEQILNPIFQECKFYDSYEGVLIRLFNFKDKWYLGTHRKLNAFKSKWASKKSFGDYFKSALQYKIDNNEEFRNFVYEDGKKVDESILLSFYKKLDKNKQYMFLMLNSEENRIVCSPPKTPTIFHVGTFINNELVMSEDIKIPYPQEHKFSNINELLDYTDMVDIGVLQGVICFAPNNKQYKLFNYDYHKLFQVRGNEPSINFRYLQIRMDLDMADALYRLYPKYAENFDKYENMLYYIAKTIYNSYVERFIKKNFITLPPEEYHVMKECHSIYLQNRDKNKINLNRVIDVLNMQTPTSLNRMIRRLKLKELKEKEES